ncbi:MAG: amidohydrolase [Clostridia bacterium]|nr:amidohydrolase [Clostridia bacterium]
MPLFEVTEYDRRVYNEELKDFLPSHIFDLHTHVYLKEHLEKPAPGEVRRTVTWPDLVAEDDSVEDLIETYRLMFPDKKVDALMFSTTKAIEKGNAYIVDCMKKTGWPGLYFSHPLQSGDEIEREIMKGGFIGLKSYLSLSPKYLPEKEIRIFDFFPHAQLAALNRMGAILMLHIPRDGRLKDPVNLAQIIEIREKYPDIRLVIAHIGRAYTATDVGNAFEVLDAAGCGFTFDFTANCSEYAITECLRHAGPANLMFGTDMPILRMRCRRIDDNGRYVNLVPPGLYGDISGDPHMREVPADEADRITFFAYEELLAFKRAVKTLGLTEKDVEDVMCGNAVRLCEAAKRSIYGK